MSFYQELLTLGQWLQPEEKFALYKFLLETQQARYVKDADRLLATGQLDTSIGNGEIAYSLMGSTVSYAARKKNSEEQFENLRTTTLSPIPFLRSVRLQKFFAQSEVDVVSNFPLPGNNPQEQSGYGFSAYPFYDLKYFSEGKSRLLGLIKKLQLDNSEILNKIRAS